MALDRILAFQELAQEPYIEYEGLDFEQYFAELLGVTRTERDRVQQVVLYVDKEQAPYVLTKPIHSSQQLIREDAEGIEISIHVVVNMELEREILGFGENMKVLAPRALAERIQK